MLILWLTGCGSFRDCKDIDTSLADQLPGRLSETGLLDDPRVLPYEVRFGLWTDGAEKRRWILLPEGTAIDTSRADSWDFPVGTRLFKEFSRDGVQLETRMLERTEQGWGAVAYRWLPDGSDAVALPEGEEDAGGTAHDVPEASLCTACHGGRESFVLGFGAVQLADQLDDLYSQGLLTDPVEVELPGDELDQEVMGYLHANCSHCHNPDRDVGQRGGRCYDPRADLDLDFTLPTAAGSMQDLPAILTADGLLGDSDRSFVLHKMTRRNKSMVDPSMPPLGTEEVDQDAVERMERWLERR